MNRQVAQHPGDDARGFDPGSGAHLQHRSVPLDPLIHQGSDTVETLRFALILRQPDNAAGVKAVKAFITAPRKIKGGQGSPHVGPVGPLQARCQQSGRCPRRAACRPGGVEYDNLAPPPCEGARQAGAGNAGTDDRDLPRLRYCRAGCSRKHGLQPLALASVAGAFGDLETGFLQPPPDMSGHGERADPRARR